MAGFGAVKELLFGRWLSHQLETAAFNALEIERVVASAGADLDIERDEAIRLLIRLTRAGGTFKANDGLITWRG